MRIRADACWCHEDHRYNTRRRNTGTFERNPATQGVTDEVGSIFTLTGEKIEGKAREIANEVGNAVKGWRKDAAALDLSAAEIDRMASAFEHGDLKKALAS